MVPGDCTSVATQIAGRTPALALVELETPHEDQIAKLEMRAGVAEQAGACECSAAQSN